MSGCGGGGAPVSCKDTDTCTGDQRSGKDSISGGGKAGSKAVAGLGGWQEETEFLGQTALPPVLQMRKQRPRKN